MTVELMELVAVLLLAAAFASSLVAVLAVHERWRLIATGARLGALGTLIAGLVLSVVARGQWSPFNLHQLSLSLSIASLAIGLVTFRAWDLPAPDPVFDAILLAIVLAGWLLIGPGGPLLTCAQRHVLFLAQWALYVLGAGGAIVAAAAGLGWLLRKIPRLRTLRWTPADELLRPLLETVLATLLSLGAGLVLGLAWAWRTYGTLSSGDPRQQWMASAWLLAAMSLLAWQLERGNRWWASAFAMIAGAAVLFGLLAILDVQRLWGV